MPLLLSPVRCAAVAAASILNREMKRRGAVLVPAARLGTPGDQRFHRCRASGADGAVQRRYAAFVCHIWIGAGPDQAIDRGDTIDRVAIYFSAACVVGCQTFESAA